MGTSTVLNSVSMRVIAGKPPLEAEIFVLREPSPIVKAYVQMLSI